MNETNADFAIEAERAASERSSESSFLDVFLQEAGRLKQIIAGMGLSVSDAEDILQDVSIQAVKKPGKSRDREQAVRWLIKVTVNQCLTEHRRRKRFRRKASEILKRRLDAEQSSTRADDKVIAAEELEIMREALQKLDDSLLTPMVLRYFCDLNSKEVGHILSLRPSTVRSRLREGRMILARRLIARGIEP